jgi:hypothetical protein
MLGEIVMCAALITAPACVANSDAAKDWKGYEPSLYTGKHYHKKWAGVRKCIMHRESRSNYRARSSILPLGRVPILGQPMAGKPHLHDD